MLSRVRVNSRKNSLVRVDAFIETRVDRGGSMRSIGSEAEVKDLEKEGD